MRKLVAGIITAIMVLLLGVTAFAAETGTAQNGGKSIDVQAEAVYINPDDVYDAPVKDGKASLTLAAGTVISVTTEGTALDGLTLNVIEMVWQEKEGYAWIFGIMDELCDKFTAYDIYFTDGDGNRVHVTGSVTVSVTTPDGYKNIQVYHVSSNGKNDKVDSKQSGNDTVFTATGFSYYVLADKADDNGGADPDQPGNPDAPPTGGNSNMRLWMALMLVSCGALAAFGAANKRRKANGRVAS